MYERLVLVTRSTRLEGLIRRFNTRSQARFYLERSGGNFSTYQEEHEAYHRSLEELERSLDLGLRRQIVALQHLPNFLFSKEDVVVVLGQDGLVANTAKYLGGATHGGGES
jgi:NAD kinase